MESTELLTSRQVAAELKTTITTVNRWVSSGKLEPASVVPGYNGARLFAAADVEQLKKSGA